jgi:hypothetical protein
MLVVILALALVPMPVLRDGAKIDHVSTSSKISATSSGSGVRGGARKGDLERLAYQGCRGDAGYRGKQSRAPTRESRVELRVHGEVRPDQSHVRTTTSRLHSFISQFSF